MREFLYDYGDDAERLSIRKQSYDRLLSREAGKYADVVADKDEQLNR